MDYKFITDEFDGEGTHGDYAYRWSILPDGYFVQVLTLDKSFCYVLTRPEGDTQMVRFADYDMVKDVAGDVFVLLTDIAAEIERRLEGAEGE